jgi:hypothetical protein
MAETIDKDALCRKLTRARRLIAGPLDPVTIDRLKAYYADLERQLADMDAKEEGASPECF